MGMLYGLLDLLNMDETQFCFVDDGPTGTGLDRVDAARPARGEPAAEIYPPDARVYMSRKFGGMELPDFVSNTCGLLIVHKRVKEVIERVNQGPTEFLALSIYNHKKRLASADYFVVNPLGTHDVLDMSASEIQWLDGDVVAIDKMMLDAEKVRQAPDLFRPREDPRSYIISKRIASPLRELDPPNTNRNYRDYWDL
jgi:hypothetical protein